MQKKMNSQFVGYFVNVEQLRISLWINGQSIPGLGHEKDKINVEHLVVSETNEVLQRMAAFQETKEPAEKRSHWPKLKQSEKQTK